MTAAKAATEGARALRERGWWLRAEPAARGDDRIRRTTAETVIESR
jgi:hypothetical protein